MRGMANDGKLRWERLPVNDRFHTENLRMEFWRTTEGFLVRTCGGPGGLSRLRT